MPIPTDTPIDDLPLAFVDVETTGLRPTLGHRVCEISITRVEPEGPPRTFTSQVNPQRSIEPEAASVHGLTAEALAAAPTFASLLPALTELLQGSVVIAHNAPFDVGFLTVEHQLAGEPVPDAPVLYTLALAPPIFQLESGALLALAQHFALPHDDLHRAETDVAITRAVFERLVDALAETLDGDRRRVTLGLLLGRQERHVPWTIPEPEELPEVIGVALEKGLAVEIDYRKASGEVSERRIEPMLASDRHLVAFCHLRNEQRTFRLDRILDARWPEG